MPKSILFCARSFILPQHPLSPPVHLPRCRCGNVTVYQTYFQPSLEYFRLQQTVCWEKSRSGSRILYCSLLRLNTKTVGIVSTFMRKYKPVISDIYTCISSQKPQHERQGYYSNEIVKIPHGSVIIANQGCSPQIIVLFLIFQRYGYFQSKMYMRRIQYLEIINNTCYFTFFLNTNCFRKKV